MPPPPPAAYHPRAVLLVAAFGPRIQRASVVGLVAGIVAGAVAGFGTAAWAPWPLVALIAAVAAALVGTVAAIAMLPTTIRRAFEAFSWLGHRDVARFRERTGSRTPGTATEVGEWLALHPRGSVPPWIRAEMLISVGRVAEARAELAAIPAQTELDRLQDVATRAYADVVETASLDTVRFAAELSTFGAPSELALEAAVIDAVTKARLRLATGSPAPLAPLVAVRPRLGREATRIVLRDTWLPFARTLAGCGIAAGILLFVTGVAH